MNFKKKQQFIGTLSGAPKGAPIGGLAPEKPTPKLEVRDCRLLCRLLLLKVLPRLGLSGVLFVPLLGFMQALSVCFAGDAPWDARSFNGIAVARTVHS